MVALVLCNRQTLHGQLKTLIFQVHENMNAFSDMHVAQTVDMSHRLYDLELLSLLNGGFLRMTEPGIIIE